MPGRMNWTRAAQESRIARYGAEPLAPEDRTILGGKPRLDPKKAKPPQHRPPRKRKLWEPLEGASPAKAAQIAARLDAAAARARRKKEQAEARRAAAAEAAAAARKARIEAARARAAARLAAMTPEQRAAMERKAAAKADARLRGVVVEQRPLAKRKARGKTGPSA